MTHPRVPPPIIMPPPCFATPALAALMTLSILSIEAYGLFLRIPKKRDAKD